MLKSQIQLGARCPPSSAAYGLNISYIALCYSAGSSPGEDVLENGGSHEAPSTSASHLRDTLQTAGQPQVDTTHPDVAVGEPRTMDKATQVSEEMPKLSNQTPPFCHASRVTAKVAAPSPPSTSYLPPP